MADFDLLPAKTQTPSSSHKLGALHIPVSVALTVGMLALNKTTRIAQLPKGFILTGVSGIVPILDSNGAPTLTWSLGDATTAGRIIANTTKGRTAVGNITIADMVTAGFIDEYTAKTDILFKATAAAATAVAGTLKLVINGYMR